MHSRVYSFSDKAWRGFVYLNQFICLTTSETIMLQWFTVSHKCRRHSSMFICCCSLLSLPSNTMLSHGEIINNLMLLYEYDCLGEAIRQTFREKATSLTVQPMEKRLNKCPEQMYWKTADEYQLEQRKVFWVSYAFELYNLPQQAALGRQSLLKSQLRVLHSAGKPALCPTTWDCAIWNIKQEQEERAESGFHLCARQIHWMLWYRLSDI